MSTLVIGNTYNEHLVGDLDAFAAADRRSAGNIALRLSWLLEPGDALVLPQAPSTGFMRHLLALKGIPADSVTVLVPPPGRYGTDVLSRERLLDDRFAERVRSVVAAQGIHRVLPYSFDSTVAQLVRRLGLEAGTPGFAFLEAGGSDLLNSKAVFRAMASGVGVPLAPGTVTASRDAATAFVNQLMEAGKPVIVKQDVHAGGFGNDILSPYDGVQPIGAPRTVVLRSPQAVAEHIDRHWRAYTSGGRHQVVVERYFPDSVALGAEVSVTDDGISVRHIGEMRMAPIFDGIAIPGCVASAAQQESYRDMMRRLCVPLQAMGYRGYINIDGILTPSGDVMLTEFNGRLGGTTHLHWIGETFLGPDYAREHLLVTRNRWKVPSLEQTLARLRDRGLSFDRARGHGVIVTNDQVSQSGGVEYCAVAGDRRGAELLEKALADLFADGPDSSPHLVGDAGAASGSGELASALT